MEKTEVDIVVSWLDDSDEAWRAQYLRYKNEKDGIDEEANPEARFRDYGTFKYWFRAIEKNAPWVHKIYLVTCGHLPDWLNTQHPKLEVVSHADFIPPEYLPTFASDTIALNLHRIPGLSEHFIYFNDDMFMINPARETGFFKHGKPRDMLTLVPAQTYEEFNHFAINNMILIHKEFSKRDILKNSLWKMINVRTGIVYLGTTVLQLLYPNVSDILHFHLPTPLKRSLYEQLWDRHFESFDKTCRHRFREVTDVTDWYIRMYYLASGDFEPQRMHRFGRLVNIKYCKSFERMLRSNYKVVCFNDDHTLSYEGFLQKKEALQHAFGNRFPDKSAFEK